MNHSVNPWCWKAKLDFSRLVQAFSLHHQESLAHWQAKPNRLPPLSPTTWVLQGRLEPFWSLSASLGWILQTGPGVPAEALQQAAGLFPALLVERGIGGDRLHVIALLVLVGLADTGP